MQIFFYLSFAGIILATQILLNNSINKGVTPEQYLLFKELSKFQAIAYAVPTATGAYVWKILLSPYNPEIPMCHILL